MQVLGASGLRVVSLLWIACILFQAIYLHHSNAFVGRNAVIPASTTAQCTLWCLNISKFYDHGYPSKLKTFGCMTVLDGVYPCGVST